MQFQHRDVFFFSFFFEVFHADKIGQPCMISGKRLDLSNKNPLKFSLFFFTENSSKLASAFLPRKRVKSAFRLNSFYLVKSDF